MKKGILLVILLSAKILLSPAEDVKDFEWYLAEAEEAISAERYEYAVSVLKEAKNKFPDTPVFWDILGGLYYEKELFSLALKEYEQARERAPEDFDILYSLAATQGRLNRDFESVSTLEEILRYYPESLDVIVDLGWMYFKTFQLVKGEQLLKKALETHGSSAGLLMTLGTVYSGMYAYDDAKKYYLESIDAALEEDRKYFASVAFYNLSLLEQAFYKYEEALDVTRRSLQMAERAPGHIALGELYQLKADYKSAGEEYEKAFSLDTTPLAMMNLADLYSEVGNPEKALSYLEEITNAEDTSWMFYFGTDMKRHQLELHRIYSDVYQAASIKARMMPRRGFKRVNGYIQSIFRKVLSWYHERQVQGFMSGCGDVIS